MLNKEIIEMYREGYSINQIAEKLNTYGQKIRRILIKANEPLRNRSEAQKNAINSGRSKHPTEGRKRTIEEKISISKSAVDYWSALDETELEKRKKRSKEVWDQMGKDKHEKMREAGLQAIRKAAKEGSKLEKAVQRILAKNNIPYESHKKDLIPTQKLEIDIYIPAFRTIIEVDGPSHFEPIWGEEQLAKQQYFDQQKMGLMLQRGFSILRIEYLSNALSISKLETLEKRVIETLNEIKTGNSEKFRTIRYE